MRGIPLCSSLKITVQIGLAVTVSLNVTAGHSIKIALNDIRLCLQSVYTYLKELLSM
jgi:hypothetical protein